jgi:hypothetical protein
LPVLPSGSGITALLGHILLMPVGIGDSAFCHPTTDEEFTTVATVAHDRVRYLPLARRFSVRVQWLFAIIRNPYGLFYLS